MQNVRLQLGKTTITQGDKAGAEFISSKLEYSPLGQVVSETYFDATGQAIESVEYDYDEEGFLISELMFDFPSI